MEHGSISTLVNFHALGELVKGVGGQSWVCGSETTQFKVIAYAWHHPGHHFSRACQSCADHFSPVDQFTLKRLIEAQHQQLSVAEIIAYLRFSKNDPKALKRVMARLMNLLSNLTNMEVSQLKETMHQVWQNYYWLGESDDLAFMIGCFFYEVNDFSVALKYFNFSVELYGPDSGTLANIRHCEELLESDKTLDDE